MYDINYFSIYKKKKNKNNGIKAFLIVFLSLFVIVNAALVGGGFLVFNSLNKSIDEKQAYINSEELKLKIEEANRIKSQSTLANQYLTILKNCTRKLVVMDRIDTALLNKVQSLTPATTSYAFTEYSGVLVTLECTSAVITDPMDMYHAFLNDDTFVTVTLSGITSSVPTGYTFSIICQVKEGGVQ